MTDRARFDQNNRNTLIVSSTDGSGTPVELWADPTTHALVTSGGGGGGTSDVNIKQIGATTVVTGGIAGTFGVGGMTAAGSSNAGNPVKIGGQARTTNPTAVTNGQLVDATFDKLGKIVVVGSIRELKGRQTTTITSSTAETTIVTAQASTFLDIYRLVIANTSATACSVTIKDSTAGSVVDVIEVPANDTRGWSGPESAAANQTTVNNNWTATCGGSVASIIITAYYARNT